MKKFNCRVRYMTELTRKPVSIRTLIRSEESIFHVSNEAVKMLKQSVSEEPTWIEVSVKW